MLFTHFGISGPLVLSASAHMRPFEANKYRADIDLKPALELSQIDAKLVSLFETEHSKNLSNILCTMLPKSMTEPFCRMCGLAPDSKPGALTKSDRRRLAENFKRFSLHITAMRPMAEAIVTSGGVNVKQINPSTMESKLVPGLVFCRRGHGCWTPILAALTCRSPFQRPVLPLWTPQNLSFRRKKYDFDCY